MTWYATAFSGALLALVHLPAVADEFAAAPKVDESSGEAPALPPVAAKVAVTASPVVEEVRRDPLAGAVTTVGARQIEDLHAGDPAAALRRPARPVSWVYSPGVSGACCSPLNLTSRSSTTERAGMLMPRARVSVANTTFTSLR